jgi:hypothetical protein
MIVRAKEGGGHVLPLIPRPKMSEAGWHHNKSYGRLQSSNSRIAYFDESVRMARKEHLEDGVLIWR